jgi:glycosyltransferase involved in cell wall biosynthesis
MLTRLRDFRIVHVQNIDAPLLAGILCKVLLARYLVVTIHGEPILALIRKSLSGVLRLRLMYKFADKFVAISRPMREQLRRDNVPLSRIHLIPNGIDTTIFHPPSRIQKQQARRQLNIHEPESVVLYLGRLINTKRVDLLLNAWSQLSLEQPRRLLIVGDGPERKALEKIAFSLQPGSVRFEGSTSNARCYYHAADVFVLPSQQEGLSVALLEAMATGLAVIVTSLPGNRQLIFHEKSGLIIPVDNLNALVKTLDLLLQSVDLQKRLGQNACTSSANYSIPSVAKAHLIVYSDLQTQAQ